MYDIKTVQVSDGFGNKRSVLIYHIKLQCMHLCKSNFGVSLLGLGGGGGLLDNAWVSNHKNYRVLDKDIHPRYTPLFIKYKNITLNAIYYYSDTFFVIFTFSSMYMAWCLTLYYYYIYGWALAIYNYFSFIPVPFYHKLLSACWYPCHNPPPLKAMHKASRRPGGADESDNRGQHSSSLAKPFNNSCRLLADMSPLCKSGETRWVMMRLLMSAYKNPVCPLNSVVIS